MDSPAATDLSQAMSALGMAPKSNFQTDEKLDRLAPKIGGETRAVRWWDLDAVGTRVSEPRQSPGGVL
jgi:hypothetical protein